MGGSIENTGFKWDTTTIGTGIEVSNNR